MKKYTLGIVGAVALGGAALLASHSGVFKATQHNYTLSLRGLLGAGAGEMGNPSPPHIEDVNNPTRNGESLNGFSMNGFSVNGLQGFSMNGLQGFNGFQGLQGFSMNGFNGLQGMQGMQGFSVNGLQGIQGLQGLQGLQTFQGSGGSPPLGAASIPGVDVTVLPSNTKAAIKSIVHAIVLGDTVDNVNLGDNLVNQFDDTLTAGGTFAARVTPLLNTFINADISGVTGDTLRKVCLWPGYRRLCQDMETYVSTHASTPADMTNKAGFIGVTVFHLANAVFYLTYLSSYWQTNDCTHFSNLDAADYLCTTARLDAFAQVLLHYTCLALWDANDQYVSFTATGKTQSLRGWINSINLMPPFTGTVTPFTYTGATTAEQYREVRDAIVTSIAELINLHVELNFSRLQRATNDCTASVQTLYPVKEAAFNCIVLTSDQATALTAAGYNVSLGLACIFTKGWTMARAPAAQPTPTFFDQTAGTVVVNPWGTNPTTSYTDSCANPRTVETITSDITIAYTPNITLVFKAKAWGQQQTACDTTYCRALEAGHTQDPTNPAQIKYAAACGSSVFACPGYSVCRTGGVPNSQVWCGTACFDLQTSFSHCGSCGISCTGLQTCVAGICT